MQYCGKCAHFELQPVDKNAFFERITVLWGKCGLEGQLYDQYCHAEKTPACLNFEERNA